MEKVGCPSSDVLGGEWSGCGWYHLSVQWRRQAQAADDGTTKFASGGGSRVSLGGGEHGPNMPTTFAPGLKSDGWDELRRGLRCMCLSSCLCFYSWSSLHSRRNRWADWAPKEGSREATTAVELLGSDQCGLLRSDLATPFLFSSSSLLRSSLSLVGEVGGAGHEGMDSGTRRACLIGKKICPYMSHRIYGHTFKILNVV
jgi:hypothetical protein